ncbi:hypothetical protein [Cupriavidus alkaliphilus]|uniref:Putative Ca2+/H+ antiporter (TMEM165/GDT1 family) n=1 Tax=Cupriavidus alkaliphilus TaxID=942866 RepID=A0A7W4YUA5_9BURK|nr:hypothetical protein [Cupriavidus alkaliphilus]MBB3010036.1 putative Ca2+/H+ antiporter (TMEM165/GDT1 family) [Cupriavidus alkaliphilus]
MATSVVSAVIVDAVRLVAYATTMLASYAPQARTLALPVAVGALCAFIGALAGKPILQKVTLHTVQLVVGFAMLSFGTGLAVGVL